MDEATEEKVKKIKKDAEARVIDVVLKGGFPAPKDAGGTVYRIRARC